MRFFIRLNNKHKGFTYFDTLLSLTLSISILLSIVILTKLQFNDFYKAKEYFHKIYVTSKINLLMLKIMKDIDFHNFKILPLIHNNKVSYKDGTLSNISKRNDSLSKEIDSDAITYLKLNTNNLLKTLHYKSGSFYVCPFFKKKVSINDTRTYLALTTDDFFEVELNIVKDKNCFITKVTNTKSILTNQAPKNIKFIAFIPIESTYTIYLANNKTLRYVTHKNNEIVENQPIMQNIYKIKFKNSFKDNFYNLSCKLKIYENDKNEILISRDNLLIRQDMFNFVSYINNNDNDYEKS